MSVFLYCTSMRGVMGLVRSKVQSRNTNSVRCDDLSKGKDLKVVLRIMSALPPESRHVRCTTLCPLSANSGRRTFLFDHFVDASEQRGRGESEGGGPSCYSYRTVQHPPDCK